MEIKMDRAKAGLLLLTAEWFTKIGASKGYYKKLPGLIDGDAKKIAQILKKDLIIVNPGVIDTKEKVDRAVVSMEGEIGTAVALLILKKLACYLLGCSSTHSWRIPRKSLPSV